MQETRTKQLEHWRQLIVSYQSSISSFRLAPASSPYFKNDTLDRRLNTEGVDLVIGYLIEKGNAEWEDTSKSSLFIFYKSIATQADELYAWADKKGYINNVLTLYELHSGDEHTDTGLVGVDVAIVKKVLEILERKNKCIYIRGDTSEDDGVKFI